MRRFYFKMLPLIMIMQTGGRAQEAGLDTLKTAPAEREYSMSKSPIGAVFRSAVLPGWGQLYNESYWKIPVVVGLGAFLVRGVIVEHGSFIDYRDLYAASITPANSSGDLRLKQFRELYRNNRDTYAWWFLVLYLVQVADAFVDAHLFDFDVGDSIALKTDAVSGARLVFAVRF